MTEFHAEVQTHMLLMMTPIRNHVDSPQNPQRHVSRQWNTADTTQVVGRRRLGTALAYESLLESTNSQWAATA